ncbi:GNAT family N-acetyltransferase [Mycolicibacterium tokaiense]|nr:GNAT family N-acetyltransferase [Mycolicibacterium tokaiense]BBY86489.1 hypothetical protein MTOK_22710 [Mycolicibacterium tokaiense]
MLCSTSGRRWLRQGVRVRFSSRRDAIGLRRDVEVPFVAPAAKVPVTVRRLQPDDDVSFLDRVPALDLEVANELIGRRRLVDSRVATCWIAVDSAGVPCYLQWLIGPSDNAFIRRWWKGLFPQLGPNEALLEGAYTAETHRGQGIMAHAMAKITEQASDIGARYVITFVGTDNIASLKGCERAGFVPYLEREDIWSGFRHQVHFRPLAPDRTPG